MGMDTDIMGATKATTAMPPGSITIITNIARSSATAPAFVTATSIGGMGISTVSAIGRHGVIRID